MYTPSGRKTSPGQTCKDIKLHNPSFKSDYYFVDPNEGSAMDAIKVFCNFEAEATCVLPRDQYKNQRWTKETRAGQYFMEEINNGKEFTYKADTYQIRFLQLLSTRATQTITYSCLNSSPVGTKLVTDQGDDVDAALGRFRRTTTVTVTDNCRKNNQWGKATFEVQTAQAAVLPISDVMLFDVGHENQGFGIDVGMVCFS